MTGDYRIDFTITYRGPDGDDFKEIGFGSSAGRESVNAAAGDVEAIVQNRIWETSGDMPDPETVDRGVNG